MKKLTLAALLATVSSVACATPATTFDNVAISYASWKVDDIHFSLKGMALDGTKLITEHLYINAQILSVGENDTSSGPIQDIDVKEQKLSLGYRLELGAQTDAYAQFGFVRQSVDSEALYDDIIDNASESDNGNSILVGVKHNFGKFEGGVFAERLNGGGDNETSTIYGVDGRYKFTDNFHAVAQYGKESDFNSYKVGVSYAF